MDDDIRDPNELEDEEFGEGDEKLDVGEEDEDDDLGLEAEEE